MYTHKKSIHMLIFGKGRKVYFLGGLDSFSLEQSLLRTKLHFFIIGSFTDVNMYIVQVCQCYIWYCKETFERVGRYH